MASYNRKYQEGKIFVKTKILPKTKLGKCRFVMERYNFQRKEIPQNIIPHICHFFYTNIFWGLEILLSKVRKFATNRINYTLCVQLHTVCKIYTLCVSLYTVCKITHCVQNYTLCAKLHTVQIIHCANYTLCVKLHIPCVITPCV